MNDSLQLHPDESDPHALPPDSELGTIVRSFRTARVLVVGDLILDRYVIGSVQRLSPEAPIPVLRPNRRQATLGGAANVALNIATLGGQAWLAGVVGDDAAGTEIMALLASTGRIHSALVTGARTADHREDPVPGRGASVAAARRGDHASIEPEVAEALLERIDTLLETIDVVVLSDYAKGVLSDTVLARVLALAGTHDRMVIADPKRADFAAYRGATVLTPNESEIRLGTRIEASDDLGAERAGRVALAATGGEAVLVTRSEKGLTLVRRDQETVHLPTRAREVADVSGAGDTLVAALAVAVAAGAALPEAAMLANVTAGISVGKPGTATVTGEELLGVLHLQELVASDRKVAASWSEAAAERLPGARAGCGSASPMAAST